jgi:RNA polymerase sigma-70 factor (ECF subfamily)
MSRAADEFSAQIVALLPRLRRFARSIAGDRDDADDLVQISVERALMREDQWQRGTRLDSWLFRIIRNAWIDEARSRVRRNRVLVPEEAGEHIGDRGAEAPMLLLSIQQAIARLPEEQRIVIGLVLIEGLPYGEAADILEMPVGTLTSRLARARVALQSMLSDDA